MVRESGPESEFRNSCVEILLERGQSSRKKVGEKLDLCATLGDSVKALHDSGYRKDPSRLHRLAARLCVRDDVPDTLLRLLAGRTRARNFLHQVVATDWNAS